MVWSGRTGKHRYSVAEGCQGTILVLGRFHSQVTGQGFTLGSRRGYCRDHTPSSALAQHSQPFLITLLPLNECKHGLCACMGCGGEEQVGAGARRGRVRLHPLPVAWDPSLDLSRAGAPCQGPSQSLWCGQSRGE